MTSTAAQKRWLYGPAADLLLGCGLWYVLLFGVLVFAGPTIRERQAAYLAPLLIMLIATPHYGATLVRVYEQRAERRAYAFFTVWTTLALLVVFVAAVQQAAIGTLLFTVYLTWSPWHYTGQNYGIAVMFLGRRDMTPSRTTKRWLYAAFILSYVLTFLVMHRSDGTNRALSEGGVHLARLGIPDAIASPLVPVVAAAYAVALVVAATRLLRRGTPRDLLPVALIALSQALWFTLPDLARSFDAAGGVEAIDFDYRANYFNWIVVAHAAQYLWVTSYYARAGSDWHGHTRYFSKTLLAGNLAWLLPALVFAPQILGGRASELDVALVVAALVNVHHFILDGAIWKLRKSPIADILIRSRDTEAELDAARKKKSAKSGKQHARPKLSRVRTRTVVWAFATVLLAIAVSEFGVRQVMIPRRADAGDLDGVRNLLDGLALIGRDSATMRLALGHALFDEGREDDALSEYRRSSRLTASVDAFAAAAALELRVESPERALASIDQALEIAPARIDVLTLAGRINAALGQNDRARYYYGEALRQNPSWQAAREGLHALPPTRVKRGS